MDKGGKFKKASSVMAPRVRYYLSFRLSIRRRQADTRNTSRSTQGDVTA